MFSQKLPQQSKKNVLAKEHTYFLGNKTYTCQYLFSEVSSKGTVAALKKKSQSERGSYIKKPLKMIRYIVGMAQKGEEGEGQGDESLNGHCTKSKRTWKASFGHAAVRQFLVSTDVEKIIFLHKLTQQGHNFRRLPFLDDNDTVQRLRSKAKESWGGPIFI